MRKPILAAGLTVALLGGLAPAPAEAADVAAFLARADAVEKMGLRAMVSSEAKLLMEELSAGNRALRAERLAAQAAGRRPAYCPAPDNRTDPREILTALRAIPPARRAGIELKDAMRAFYARRYPCPAG